MPPVSDIPIEHDLFIPDQKTFHAWTQGQAITDEQLNELAYFYRNLIAAMEAIGIKLLVDTFNTELYSITSLQDRRKQ